MRRILLTLALVLCAALSADAQNIVLYRQTLQQPDTIWGAKVNVVESDNVSTHLSSLIAQPKQSEIYGYRIAIFSDNSQTARAQAFEICNAFAEQYAGIPAEVSYDKLYWKVTVGQCATAEEAIALWGRIKQAYPKAFLTRETISIEELNK
jgi:hypothetical protein